MNKKNNNLAGFLLIDKPENITSFDCIRHIKKVLQQKVKTCPEQRRRVGHTGTLDDFATGMLIIAIDRSATRLISTLMNQDKEYIVTAKLGELTDSLDKTGKVIEQQKNINVTTQDLENAIKKLGSSYEQVPPIYCALKHKGEALYKLVREKKLDTKTLEAIVQQKKRTVKITKIELTDYTPPLFTIKTTVSKGTYIRSLANDIAQKLNLHATTRQLQRTKIGNLNLQDCVKLSNLKSVDDIENAICSIEQIQSKLLTD